MMLNDVKSFSYRQRYRDHPLVQQMLQIQDFEYTQLKSFGWMKHLLCLSIHKTSAPTTGHGAYDVVLREVEANFFDKQHFEYITISYTWHPARFESSKNQSFKIRTLDGGCSANTVRDTIIWRAVQYVQHHNFKGFWIDGQSLDQNNTKKHKIAMHSMDRLYADSPRSVGMMTTRVDRQWKLDALYSLLDGSLFKGTGDDVVVNFPPSLAHQGFWRVLRWFVRFLSDPWWQRSWIFQEEYCAAQNMFILIPCERSLRRHSPIFGSMRDEIEISAIELRTRCTTFATACQCDTRLNAKQRHYVQRSVLKKAERYQTSYTHGRHRGHTLSSLIMADLQQRRIKRPRDFLAISANCCAYARRLDHEALEQQNNISLGLSLFVQALLNGELLDNQIRRRSHSKGGFAKFFLEQMFTDVHPPMGMESLTFLKHCRFSNVELCGEGIVTNGHIWHISGVLDIDFPKAAHRVALNKGFDVSFESLWTCLEELARRLRPSQPSLTTQVSRYVVNTKQRKIFDARDEVTIAMAKEIAYAWSTGRTLVVGNLRDGVNSRAIFSVPEQHSLPEWVFTS